MRIEKDFIGEMAVPKDALYGIHAMRARHNFPDESRFSLAWYRAMGLVKQSCYITAQTFYASAKKALGDDLGIRVITDDKLEAMIEAAQEVAEGQHYAHFIVPVVQGGAGTSINMNVNEIIANVSLQKLDKSLGDYACIDPVEEANIFQSTNDVVPTALRVAALQLLSTLEVEVNDLRQVVEKQEQTYRHTLRLAYTQMQEAVPSSYGRLFSTYSDALSRDWWRVSKCFERIKTVNLGGSAIGSGITVPRYVIMEVAQVLKDLSGLPITRSENMHDTTANLDALVEVHAILKALAVNLEKMANDLRLLASDSYGEIVLPQQQVGSSIMPAKVNPVVVEYVISVSQVIYANDMLITQLASQGCLDLNAYLPVIGDKLLQSLHLLIGASQTMKDNMLVGLTVNTDKAYERLIHSPAITTALLPYVGYHKAAQLGRKMKEAHLDVFQANALLNVLDNDKLTQLMKAESLLKEGFSIREL